MSFTVALTVNGRPVSVETDERALLSSVLREALGLTGTHVGCDTSQCGACVVLLDGRSVKACTVLAAQADGGEVLTVEGLAGEGLAGPDGSLHPMQAAFHEHHGLQCGFCTPGMVLSAIELARTTPDLDEQAVRDGLEGNLCRCTGYQNIVKAVLAGAAAMRAAG
ncbi:MAG TPA: (2Fe-2S)-binding protein [Azospirillaceae bacterium]|mgnify:CR=1 FL=1|nr:(2Fe-2S)-binding protein [Azospirillaceae bacterium]HRQ79659.1 (2Fe-2S)-binding protein [Azospirillaceae bacterium]